MERDQRDMKGGQTSEYKRTEMIGIIRSQKKKEKGAYNSDL